MLGTYASFAAILGSCALVGQAVFVACGRRMPSELAPAVGLAVLAAIAWATARIVPEGAISLLAIGLATAGSLAYAARRVEGLAAALRVAGPVAVGGAVLASLPFIVEGRF